MSADYVITAEILKNKLFPWLTTNLYVLNEQKGTKRIEPTTHINAVTSAKQT